MTQQKWVYVVDHRGPRESNPRSFANFIYPNPAEEQKKGFRTAGTHGADFGELRALEQSILDPQLDFGGVLHYRRAILLSEINLTDAEIFSNVEGHFIPMWSWLESPALGWTNQKLLELSTNCLTLLPKAIDVRDLGAPNLYEQYLLGHEPQTFLELQKSWDLAEEFFDFLYSETKIIPFNMMLTTREIREDIFDWLMKIINPLESKLSRLSSDSKERRWPGYLAERLCTFYWYKKQKEIKPYFVQTLRLDLATEVSPHLYEEDYLAISKNIKHWFVLKTEATSAREGLERRIKAKEDESSLISNQLTEIQSSLSWKATAPVRKLIGRFVK